ncbi:MAG: ATP-binding protein, partial [Maribacter sp.]
MFKNFFILITLLIVCSSHAQDIYEVDPGYPVHDVNSQLKVFKDSTNSFTPEFILKDTLTNYLKGDELPRYLEIGTVYWGKLDLIIKDSIKDWKLHFEDKMIGPPAWTKSNGKVDVFVFSDDKMLFHKKTGVEYPKSDRDIDAHWALNQIGLEDFPIEQPVTLIIKNQGNELGYPAYFNLSIRSPKQPFYHQIFPYHKSFNLFLFGITFIMFVYHILQYIYLKEQVYLWFSVWLLYCVLTQAMTNGLIIGALHEHRFALQLLIANGVFYSFWFFGRSFINSRLKFPMLDKIMIGLALFLIVEILIAAISVTFFNAKATFTGVGIHYIILNIYTILSLVVSIILTLKKDLFARYFGIGSLIASSFLILGTLWGLNLVKPIIDPYATGIFLQIIFYSFGIAYRQQYLSKQNEKEKLQNQQTLAEMQRVRDLDEIKTRFFANISHEFRTPLTLITGPINQAINRMNVSNETGEIKLDQKTFNIIKNNTNRLQSLVDQLLDLSKLESGKVHLSLKQGGIIKFLRSIIFSFESMAERNNISLNTNFSVENNLAFYDKDKLEKIITNILSNALKYTPNGGTVTVAIDLNEQFLNIEITDTGKGINKVDIIRIFDRFYRVEGSEEKGSGIGLALTKELIDLHNGKISVDSTRGMGTTFKVKLPITLKHLPEAISIIEKPILKTETLNASEVPDLQLQKDKTPITTIINKADMPTALVVEDNADLRYFITNILQDHYKVISANDGLQGERMAFEHIPDIVISDIMMPKK